MNKNIWGLIISSLAQISVPSMAYQHPNTIINAPVTITNAPVSVSTSIRNRSNSKSVASGSHINNFQPHRSSKNSSSNRSVHHRLRTSQQSVRNSRLRNTSTGGIGYFVNFQF